MLSTFKHLPVSGEYYDAACYDVSKKYGKDTFVVINKLGSKYIPKLLGMKRVVDRISGNFSFLPDKLSDHMMNGSAICGQTTYLNAWKNFVASTIYISSLNQ